MEVISHFKFLIILAAFVGALILPSKAQDSPQDYVGVHNEARAGVGVGPMQWNETLAAVAQSYADQRRSDCNLIHSSGTYGENLAKSSGDLSGTRAVELWVEEKANYDYPSNTCNGECGHYTQIVWRSSVKLGCGKARCDNGGTFIVCNYDPPGNYVNEKPY
ncbi:Pathogenesis-related protein 1 [Raphanus sativus]|uniref:Pathogenesis-related protein 1 n=1 Tax=Raphanus sativus TaxID=3726 RepID=A0A6J0P0K8_RAPSA|nr:pathogenesis-related protein 1 [Raphanus sativus]KAJ4896970.1 Pathogenesis-related protein 1 [Raphanus sativus]